MTKRRIRKSAFRLGVLAATLGAAILSPKAQAASAATGLQPLQEFKLAHCCHPHPNPPYDNNCCHPPTTTSTYVAPAYGVGPASVRGVSRRTSRRTSRRVSRRR